MVIPVLAAYESSGQEFEPYRKNRFPQEDMGKTCAAHSNRVQMHRSEPVAKQIQAVAVWPVR